MPSDPRPKRVDEDALPACPASRPLAQAREGRLPEGVAGIYTVCAKKCRIVAAHENGWKE